MWVKILQRYFMANFGTSVVYSAIISQEKGIGLIFSYSGFKHFIIKNFPMINISLKLSIPMLQSSCIICEFFNYFVEYRWTLSYIIWLVVTKFYL